MVSLGPARSPSAFSKLKEKLGSSFKALGLFCHCLLYLFFASFDSLRTEQLRSAQSGCNEDRCGFLHDAVI